MRPSGTRITGFRSSPLPAPCHRHLRSHIPYKTSARLLFLCLALLFSLDFWKSASSAPQLGPSPLLPRPTGSSQARRHSLTIFRGSVASPSSPNSRNLSAAVCNSKERKRRKETQEGRKAEKKKERMHAADVGKVNFFISLHPS